MSCEKSDVVVIGAGLGGLSTAAYLAKAGRKVLVLEHHSVPGGYAHEFRRGRYRFEVALHAMDGVEAGGLSHPVLGELGVLERVSFKRLDPFYSVNFPNHHVTVPAKLLDYAGELMRQFPQSAVGIRRLIAKMCTIFQEARQWMEARLGKGVLPANIAVAYPNLFQAITQTWGSFMGSEIRDPQLQAVFSALWLYHGLPPSSLSAVNFILAWGSYHLSGGYYPQGGSMQISRAVEQTIKQHGGTIRYRQTVNRIVIEQGKATSVETIQGLRVEADAVVSNASPQETLMRMVGSEYLPAAYQQKINSDRPACASVSVYLGVTRDLTAEGWQHPELVDAPGYDTEADYRAMMAGDFARTSMYISNYTHIDPTNAPTGGSVLVLMILAPWHYANQWGTGGNLENYQKNPTYQATKNAVGDILIERAEKYIPGLRQSIRHLEIGTPLTNWRYSLNPCGSIYGSEPTVENTLFGRLPDKTPIPNLFLAGTWVSAGGMSTALLSGAMAAPKVLTWLGR